MDNGVQIDAVYTVGGIALWPDSLCVRTLVVSQKQRVIIRFEHNVTVVTCKFVQCTNYDAFVCKG